MTTYIIYPDSTQGFLTSHNANVTTAKAGSNLTVDTTSTLVKTGMNIAANKEFYVHQNFMSFDTSVIADTDEIVDATITQYVGFPLNQSGWWGQQFRSYNWTAPLTTAQWQDVTELNTRPLFANFDWLFSSSAYSTRVTGSDALIAGISKTAATKFVVCTSTQSGNGTTTGVQEVWSDSVRGANKPYLTVYTVAPNTLNGVTEASTTLPDGTTISVRSNGAAAATLTIGYTPLNGSWTSIQVLGSEFANNIDGVGAVTVTSDPAGNFFVFGLKSGTTSLVVGQGFQRLTATTWSAKTSLSQSLAMGNESTIRSQSAAYMVGGTDGKDLPEIWLMSVRGSKGNSLSYKYHVSGAGWVHDSHVLPASLLAGSGSLFKKTSGNYNPHNFSGIPATCDVVALDNSTAVAYVARGKFGNVTVGGLSTIKIYGQDGFVKSNYSAYTQTGASQLVPINGNLFAHVFDNTGLVMSVHFYNASCQFMGQTSIPKENFYGSQIGTQFAAYYDKTANLVRVFYVDVASSRTLSRYDVSPVTFTGTVTTAVHTSVGPASSTNTDLRVSRTTDERRVLIETANNSAGTLSTVSTFSTVGNVAPMAPALIARQNFDATSPATFSWKAGDANAADYSTAYQLEVSRVSDSVVVLDTGKITSTAQSVTINGNAGVITNRATNPEPGALAGWGTSSGYVRTFETVLGRPAIVATKSGTGGYVWYGRNAGTLGTSSSTPTTNANLVAVTAGETLQYSIDMGTDVAAVTGWIVARFFDTTGAELAGTAVTMGNTAMTTNTWQTISGTTTVPAGAFYTYLENVLQVSATVGGERGWAGRVYIGSPTPNYFSGATTDDANYAYTWTGTVNASTSIATPKNAMLNEIGYRWRVRTYDVIGTAGTWSGYGTFTTSATGTLTITSPAEDNLYMETDDCLITWWYEQSGGATQTKRRVRVIRTSDNAVVADTTMQTLFGNTRLVTGMESGKEYRIEVTVTNSANIVSAAVSRLITPTYSEPMAPALEINQQDSYMELIVTNPLPTGDRPEVIYNDIYKRRSSSTSGAADYKKVATISNSATYRDYNVKSEANYDYYVIGRTV